MQVPFDAGRVAPVVVQGEGPFMEGPAEVNIFDMAAEHGQV